MTNKSTGNDSQLLLEKMGIEQKVAEKLLSFNIVDYEFLLVCTHVETLPRNINGVSKHSQVALAGCRSTTT
jgi:hypothetical protein